MPKKSLLAKITGIKRHKKERQDQEDQKSTEKVDLDKIEAEQQERFQSKAVKDQNSPEEDSSQWVDQNYEGQLSVDVYQTKDEIIIKSAVAGVDPDELDISINNDMITIRGSRQQEEEIDSKNYFYQECYWGAFSRSIILPQEVKPDGAKADFKKGILTIRLPKARQAKKIQIEVSDSE